VVVPSVGAVVCRARITAASHSAASAKGFARLRVDFEIEPRRFAWSEERTDSLEWDRVAAWEAAEEEGAARARDALRKSVVVTFAGPWAEAVHLEIPEPDWSREELETDRDQGVDAAMRLTGSETAASDLRRESESEARTMLASGYLGGN
jgi:hypothetical protein